MDHTVTALEPTAVERAVRRLLCRAIGHDIVIDGDPAVFPARVHCGRCGLRGTATLEDFACRGCGAVDRENEDGSVTMRHEAGCPTA